MNTSNRTPSEYLRLIASVLNTAADDAFERKTSFIELNLEVVDGVITRLSELAAELEGESK